MKDFNSIVELHQEILADKEARLPLINRYPTRLIFLPSLQMLKEFVKLIDRHGVKKVELADFLPHNDGWMTVDELINRIKNLNNDEDLIILPMSEIARFYSHEEFSSLFNAISDIENNRTFERRIYIPLVGIYERFNNEFFENFYRKEQWTPIWKVQSTDIHKITIYIADFHVNHLPDIEIIYNTKDWLNVWKKDEIGSVICVSKTLMHCYPNRLPDQMFDIDEIKNQKEFLSKIYGINLPIDFNENNKDYCDKLISIIIKKPLRSLDEIITEIFRVINISKDEILRLWVNTNEIFKKWLLKQYIISKNEWHDTYIYSVIHSMKESDNVDLIEGLWFKIFEVESKTPQLCEERRQLLEQFYAGKEVPTSIEERLEHKINSISDNKEKLKIITGITRFEKNILLKMFINEEIGIQLLRERYKWLYYYMQEIVPDNLPEQAFWIVDYFKEYRVSKLRDIISPKLNSILVEKNENKDAFYKWYYSFETAEQILQRENVDKIIWIDALGVEWLPLLVNLIHEIGFFVEKKHIARAYLPTITDCNRFENALYIRDLDRDVHSTEPYKYSDSIIKDIELMKKILQKHLTLSREEKVAIVSDHGSTALARLKENQKMYNFKESHHDGRCMWVDDDFSEDDEMLIHAIDNPIYGGNSKVLIALRYTSLYRKPIREVHGGATPEEVLVPVVVVSRYGIANLSEYNIIPDKGRLSRKDPVLWISIIPAPDRVPILIDKKISRSIDLEFVESQQKWRANLKAFKAGKYEVAIKIGDFEKVINIEIAGGMQEDELI